MVVDLARNSTFELHGAGLSIYVFQFFEDVEPLVVFWKKLQRLVGQTEPKLLKLLSHFVIEGGLVEVRLELLAMDAGELLVQFFAHDFDGFELLHDVDVFGLELSAIIEAHQTLGVVESQL